MDRWRNMLLVPCSSRHRKYSTITGRLHGVCSVVVFWNKHDHRNDYDIYAFPRTSCIFTKGCELQNYSVYITYDVAAWCTKNERLPPLIIMCYGKTMIKKNCKQIN